MNCSNCGRPVNQDAKVCKECGAPVGRNGQKNGYSAIPDSMWSEQSTQGAPEGYNPPAEEQVQGKKKRSVGRKLLGIGAAVLSVALVGAAAVGIVMSGIFAPDQAKVSKAVMKTATAYEKASNGLKLNGVEELVKEQAFSADFGIEVESIIGTSDFEGFGLQLSQDINTEDRMADFKATAHYGALDLADVHVSMRDTEVYVLADPLAEGYVYGFDTMTLGEDLVSAGLYEELGDLSLDLFGLFEEAAEQMITYEDVHASVAEAIEELLSNMQAKKIGNKTVKVNGHRVKCMQYDVVFPRNALEDFVEALEEVSEDIDIYEVLVGYFERMHLSEEELEFLGVDLDAMEELLEEIRQETFTTIDTIMEEIGDVQMEVYVKDGYIMAVIYNTEIFEAEFAMGIELGGGENYADDLGVEVAWQVGKRKDSFVLTSTGNHTGEDDTYTDKTTIEVNLDGDKTKIVSAMAYAPESEGDNFRWTVKSGNDKLDVEGRVAIEEDTVQIDIGKLVAKVGGQELLDLEISCSIAPYEERFDLSDPEMLEDLTEDELDYLQEILEEAFVDWTEELEEEYGEELEVLGDLWEGISEYK